MNTALNSTYCFLLKLSLSFPFHPLFLFFVLNFLSSPACCDEVFPSSQVVSKWSNFWWEGGRESVEEGDYCGF